MLPLAAKLRHLIQRLAPGQKPPTSRQLAALVQALPGHTRGGSHAAINKLTRGVDDNPTISTLVALAQVLDAPTPFLLPGWDDLRSLSVLQGNQKVAEIVRHLEGIPEADLDNLLAQIKERRTQLGLSQDNDPVLIETQETEVSDRHDRRRRSPEESAKYAADSLEGLD